MKRIAVIALILVLVAGIAYAAGYEVKKKAGEYDIEVKIDKNPPVVGDNIVTVEVQDHPASTLPMRRWWLTIPCLLCPECRR